MSTLTIRCETRARANYAMKTCTAYTVELHDGPRKTLTLYDGTGDALEELDVVPLEGAGREDVVRCFVMNESGATVDRIQVS